MVTAPLRVALDPPIGGVRFEGPVPPPWHAQLTSMLWLAGAPLPMWARLSGKFAAAPPGVQHASPK
jgi:hypothetical protein